MQSVLGVDLSCQPCEITVSRMVGKAMEVVQRRTVELPLFSNQQALLRGDCSSLLPKKQEDLEAEISSTEGGVNRETGSSGSEGDLSAQVVKETVLNLRNAVRELEPGWTSAAVIVPPYEHIALNLNLPFGDAKNLSKIVDLEVQDVVPFELDEFLVQHSALGPSTSPSSSNGDSASAYDVHVALLPTQYVRNVLSMCSSAGVDPTVMTVPSSANGAIFHLAKDYFKEDAAIIHHQAETYSITLFIDGEVRAEQSLDASSIAAPEDEGSNSGINPVFTALKLMMAAAERRYGRTIEKVYLLGMVDQPAQLQQRLGRSVELILLSDIVKSQDSSVGISPLGAFFAQDEVGVLALSNFRTGEFSFRPRLFEFARALATTWTTVASAIFVLAVAVGGVYWVRDFNLAKAHEALVTELQTIVPDLPATSGDLRSALSAAETKLSEELGVLGSPAKITPLDALSEITRLIPSDKGITLLSLKITGARAVLTGIAPELSTIESLQKALKANKSLFSKVTATPGASSGSRFNFTVEILLAQ